MITRRRLFEFFAGAVGAALPLPKAQAAAPRGYEAGHVMWFNRTCGFGFVRGHETNKAIFTRANTFKASGLHHIRPGVPVFVRWEDTWKGPFAVDVQETTEHRYI